MRKFYFKITQAITALCFLLVLQNQTFAQALPCGNSNIDIAALKKAINYELTSGKTPGTASYVLRVYFHDVAYDDGSNLTARISQIDSEFNTLTADYAADNICFVNAGINLIYSTQLDTNVVATSSNRSLFNSYIIPNCINVFYLKQIKGSNPACSGSCGYGGYTFNIPDIMTLIAQGNIGHGQTVSHEVGHCLGLLHTFENWGGTSYEDIDGSNSSSSADYVTDTKADPYAYKGQSCYTESSDSCRYTGSCTDPKGQTSFSPPYSNLMGYWWNYSCYYGLALTSGQYSRVNSYLSTNSSLIACESPSYVTEGPNLLISSGYLMASAINTLTTSGTVSINGSAEVTFGGQLVSLEPGFDASPSSGYISIEPVICYSGPAASIVQQNDSSSLNTIAKAISGPSLFAFPNPAKYLFNLAISLNKNEKNVLIEIFDMNSRKVKEIELHDMLQGKQVVEMDMHNLSSGIYYVIVLAGNKTLTTKIVLER